MDLEKLETLLKRFQGVLSVHHEKLDELEKKIDRYFALHHDLRSQVNDRGLQYREDAAGWNECLTDLDGRVGHLSSEVEGMKAITMEFGALIDGASRPNG